MEVKRLPRVFEFRGTRLADPNPDLSIDQAKEALAVSRPEITNSTIDGPKQTAEAEVYTIKANVGHKG
jgi:PRTRC genetic system protein C